MKWTPGMDEVAKVSLDGSVDVSSMISMTMPTTMDHWQSESSNPLISIDFDEPVEIFNVVLIPKYVVSDAQPGNHFFQNWYLTEGERLEPNMMKESFRSIR